MATIESEKLMTAVEFGKLSGNDRPRELVRGKIIEMNVPAPRHGQVCSAINEAFRAEARRRNLGHVLSNDSGVLTQRNPDSVRGADISIYGFAKLPKGPLPSHYIDVPPDVVFEVLSPSDRRPQTMAKVAEYLEAGVRVVVVVDPERQTVCLERADGPPETLSVSDDLIIPEFSPEFRLPVKEIFE